jgi:predicted DNA binding CopG/RHH family protein
MTHQDIPEFATEEEEAEWWDNHPDLLAERFQIAKQQGKVKHLSETTLPGAAETVMLRIPQSDLSRARVLAARRGIRYETYLKMLLREALDAEEKKLAS